MSEKKLFIFDLDGTLVDAYQAIQESLNFTRKKLGYKEVSYSKVKSSVGRGDKIFIENFFSKKDADKALKIYRAHHKKSLLSCVRLNRYAKLVLYRLKRKGRYVAIASNRPTYFTNLIVKKLSIRKYIDFILCADKVKKLKPHPRIIFQIIKRFNPVKKEEAVFVGDMDIDIETAKRARIEVLFLTGGSTPAEKIRRYKDVRIIPYLTTILKLYE